FKIQVTTTHTCYLVAEAKFESYSDKARLCLIGVDRWKCPRTYISPEAIQVGECLGMEINDINKLKFFETTGEEVSKEHNSVKTKNPSAWFVEGVKERNLL
ncbi:hypothetical protein Taro_015104, partial [Colocasia esculenta]|nr:hypothetical protein [Colocasia esculenta]